MNIKNNENPLVSVIVPICNVEPYIHRCLDSIIGQTLKNIEIICVEDHSDDRSAEILKEYADRDNRIKAIFHATNLSTSQARKDGVAVSCGKYIMFVDGDDELCPDACQIASETIEKYGTDMVQFDTEVVNCAGGSERAYSDESEISVSMPGGDPRGESDLFLLERKENGIQPVE